MTLSQLIDQLNNHKEMYGDGVVNVRIQPGATTASADDERCFDIDEAVRPLTGGGVEIICTDYLWDPSWRSNQ